jgi:hypothetical protein
MPDLAEENTSTRLAMVIRAPSTVAVQAWLRGSSHPSDKHPSNVTAMATSPSRGVRHTVPAFS